MTEHKLFIHNTLTRKKEEFKPLHPGRVGMYVCGPTVYGDPHLGPARPAITCDLLFRLLKNEGYKVRYVRNITDVGHLEHDADEGEDKIAKRARIEQLEPGKPSPHCDGQRMMCSGAARFQRAKSTGLRFSVCPSSSRVVLSSSATLRLERMP